MAAIRFKVGNSWPLLRILEAARAGDSELVGLTPEEMHHLNGIMSSCLMHQESGSVQFSQVSTAGLSALMKALDALARKAEALLGAGNGPRGTAQARSLRQKILEVYTRLDLTGGL